MKTKHTSRPRSRFSILTSVALALSPALAATAAPFTPGNIVVSRAGDGSAFHTGDGFPWQSNDAAAAFLDEYTPSGTLVQSVALPTEPNGSGQRALTLNWDDTNQGFVTRSVDGRYLLIAGYDAAVETGAVNGTSNTANDGLVDRVVGRIDGDGNIDTSTAFSDDSSFTGNSIRSVASPDGYTFYVGGATSNGNTGVRRAVLGGTTSTRLGTSTAQNIRVVNIFPDVRTTGNVNGPQLFATRGGGSAAISYIGSGLPTNGNSSGNNASAVLNASGATSAYDFAFTDAGTAYLANDDDSTGNGGIIKYTLVGTTWTQQYVLNAGLASRALRGLTATKNAAGQNVLYATTGDGKKVVAVTDTGAGSTFATIASAPANTYFHGVELTPVGDDVVSDWNLTSIQVSKAQAPFTGTALNSNLATRIHAIEAVAVYNAVNSIVHVGTPYGGYSVPATSPASPEAAAAQAAHDVLVNYFPTQQAALDTALASSLAVIPNGSAKTNGLAAGSAAASHIIALRVNDGSSPNTTYPGPASPAVGVYQLTPNIPGGTAPYTFSPGINSQWGSVTPFVLSSQSQFRSPPPPAVGSAKYNTALTQVKTYGTPSNPRHTAEQTHIANFYKQDAELTVNEVARLLTAAANPTIGENAFIFALTDLAEADSRIAEWDAKYFYLSWRPITALNADPSGAVTNNYAAWQPTIVTPNHPSYPSGHSGTVVGIEVLKSIFGDTHTLTLHTTTAGEPARTVTSLSQIEVDNGLSRVYGGIHFSFDNEAGQQLGIDVANWILTHGPQLNP